jgi:peptide/nickel transport system substrate-binding protein
MRKQVLGLLATTALVFAACSTGTPTTAPTGTAGPPTTAPSPTERTINLLGSTYTPEDGVDGGSLIFADWQEATQYNPFYVGQVTEANVASAVWATTITLTVDYKYAPDLATDIPTVDNGGVEVPGQGSDAMTVTWTLKPDLKWSDGEALTCDDFKYAWEWVMDKDNTGVLTIGYEDITAFDCPDDVTMVLHYSKIFEGYITQHTSPLPRHYLKDIPVKDQVHGVGWTSADFAVLPTSGPFSFESATAGQELRLKKNPNYLGWASGKPAHLDNLIFKWYTDPDTMMADFVAGAFDIGTDVQDSDIPKMKELGITDDQINAIDAFTYEMLTPNWSAEEYTVESDGSKEGGCSTNAAVQDRGTGCPMADPAMREALPYMIDKQEINTRVLSNALTVANSPISPDAWFYSDQPPQTFDIEKAKSILDAAGWVPGSDGIRVKDGLRAKIELCTTTRQTRLDSLALDAAHMADAGIETVINGVAPADIFEIYNNATRETPCAIRRSNFDVAEFASSSSLDPLGFYTGFHSTQFYPVGGNQSQVSDPDIDKALDDVKNNVDLIVIADAMAVFQQVYIEKSLEVPLYYRKNVEMHNAHAGNFTGNPTQAGPTWNVVDWYVKP